jgi:hypothetical protein
MSLVSTSSIWSAFPFFVTKLTSKVNGFAYGESFPMKFLTSPPRVVVRLWVENRAQLWVPPGFGHRFLTLTETAELLYKTTDYYAPECERSIHWNDSTICIEWPDVGPPELAVRDASAPMLDEAEVFD